MWLPPTQAGGQVLGNTFIDGAHMVLAGPTRGQLRLLYQNSEANEQFVSYFAKCLCAHIYQYLQKEKHFTRRCCQAILGSWFDAKEGLRAMDSSWDSAMYRATPHSVSSSPSLHTRYGQAGRSGHCPGTPARNE
jgi:hypothetical protein